MFSLSTTAGAERRNSFRDAARGSASLRKRTRGARGRSRRRRGRKRRSCCHLPFQFVYVSVRIFNEKLSGKIVRYAKRRRTTTTLKRDEEIPPFFLSSADPRRFTAISKRRAHERGFENRGGVFRVSRRGGEFFSSRVCFLFLKLTKSEIYTADTFRVSLSLSFYSLSLCACMTRDSIAHQTLFLLFPSSF